MSRFLCLQIMVWGGVEGALQNSGPSDSGGRGEIVKGAEEGFLPNLFQWHRSCLDPPARHPAPVTGRPRHMSLSTWQILSTKNVLPIQYWLKCFCLFKCSLGLWSPVPEPPRFISSAVSCVFMVFLWVSLSLNTKQDNGKMIPGVTSCREIWEVTFILVCSYEELSCVNNLNGQKCHRLSKGHLWKMVVIWACIILFLPVSLFRSTRFCSSRSLNLSHKPVKNLCRCNYEFSQQIQIRHQHPFKGIWNPNVIWDREIYKVFQNAACAVGTDDS